jgi:MoxR-like ATPase
MTDRDTLGRIREALGRVIQGKTAAIDLVLVALLAGGHVLIEDAPGVGKTTLAKALARTFSVSFSRVQFTPDLLPSDILGSRVLDPRAGTFSFSPGPVFTNVLLADEINRASPRTQAALLEAMSESQATIDGVTHPLPPPFFVVATQNPVEFHGTYPLPEAQLDRFMIRVGMGYPARDAELAMLIARQHADPLDSVEPIAGAETLRSMQSSVRDVVVKEPVARFLLEIVALTRDLPELVLGVSPRGSLALYRACQARAHLDGRSYVTPADVQELAVPVLSHRIALATEARYAGRSEQAVVEELLRRVPVPL